MLQVEFAHDAAGSEDIRDKIVVVRAENALGGAVPPGGDVGSVRASLVRKVLACTEVYYLGDEGVLVDHNIIRFEIPMHDSEVIMKILETRKNLFHYYSNF